MSTGNFRTMNDFPLYAISNEEFYFEDEEGNKGYDEYYAQEFCEEISKEMDKINCDLIFHEISLVDGYYSGIQFYVKEKHDTLEYFEKYWDNYSCRYEFDLYKSQAIRKFKSEINKVNKILRNLAREYGFEEYCVYARFSNGETWYTKVS